MENELLKLKEDLKTLDSEELRRRIYMAYNGLCLVDVMLQNNMANLSSAVGCINSAKKDLRGERGEAW